MPLPCCRIEYQKWITVNLLQTALAVITQTGDLTYKVVSEIGIQSFEVFKIWPNFQQKTCKPRPRSISYRPGLLNYKIVYWTWYRLLIMSNGLSWIMDTVHKAVVISFSSHCRLTLLTLYIISTVKVLRVWTSDIWINVPCCEYRYFRLWSTGIHSREHILSTCCITVVHVINLEFMVYMHQYVSSRPYTYFLYSRLFKLNQKHGSRY